MWFEQSKLLDFFCPSVYLAGCVTGSCGLASPSFLLDGWKAWMAVDQPHLAGHLTGCLAAG